MKRAIGGFLATGALFVGGVAAITPEASASGGAVYAFQAGDHGPGGWAGGALFAGGSVTGSGNIAGPGQHPLHINFTSWTPDNVSGFVDVNFTFGPAPGVPSCIVLPITTGQHVLSPLYVGPCDTGQVVNIIPGKATPTG